MIGIASIIAAAFAVSAAATQIQISVVEGGDATVNIERYEKNEEITFTWTANGGVTSAEYEYSVHFDSETGDEVPGASSGDYIPSTGITKTFRISSRKIVEEESGDAGTPEIEGERVIVILIEKQVTEGDAEKTTREIKVKYDLKKPEPPQDLRTSPGDRNLRISWKVEEDEGDADSFKIYYRRKDSADAPASSTVSDGTARSATVDGLNNNVEYELWMTSRDDVGNESEASKEVYGTPVEVWDFGEYYKEKGGAEKGGFCFIATAVYGSYDHPDVKTLRSARDRYLVKNAAGRIFIRQYYRLGPAAARLVGGNPLLKAAARAFLAPVVFAARAATGGGAEAAVLLAWLGAAAAAACAAAGKKGRGR